MNDHYIVHYQNLFANIVGRLVFNQVVKISSSLMLFKISLVSYALDILQLGMRRGDLYLIICVSIRV